MDRLSRNPTAGPAIDSAAIFDLLPEAWLVLSERLEVLTANARYLGLVGVNLTDILGLPIYEIDQFGTADQRTAWRAWLEETQVGLGDHETRTSTTFRYETPRHDNPPVATSSGNYPMHYWQFSASRLSPDPAGRRFLALKVSEVTDHMTFAEERQRERAKLRSQAQLRQLLVEEAKAQLRENEERFRVALAFAQVGAWELNRQTGLFECTDQCKANLGLQTDATLTEHRLFDELIDPADRPRVKEVFEIALQTREHFEVDFRISAEGGVKHWILMRGLGRYRADDTLYTVLGFTLDITARKLAELEHKAIAESEKEARVHSDQIARAMDHFVTAVSHELRSPIAAILSWVQLLQRVRDFAQSQQATDVIERNARQLSHMVDDLLDSGAIATGKLSVIMRPVDLGALVGNVAEDIRMNAQAKGLELRCDALTSCLVLADESRLKQIVWNLLSNAVKFCAQGHVEVAVDIQGTWAELSVHDTGCGIEPEALGRIFERFEQIRANGSGRIGGLGLGLWLVKNLVDLHNGHIEAHSMGRGQGATFRVSLPLYP
jgi:PAS domain S-box-containing protein